MGRQDRVEEENKYIKNWAQEMCTNLKHKKYFKIIFKKLFL